MDDALDGTPKTEIKSMVISTTTEGWEELYITWQDEMVEELKAEYPETIESFYVGYTQMDENPDERAYWLYASLHRVD